MSFDEPNLACERSVDAAPYVLGALEDADAYREHLTGCASCRAQVAELQLAVDALPASVPSMTAPEELRKRVLATVRSEAELLRAAPGGAGRRAPGPGRRRPRRLSLLSGRPRDRGRRGCGRCDRDQRWFGDARARHPGAHRCEHRRRARISAPGRQPR